MTLERFERIVLRLANQTAVRYWIHWNYPCRDPWVMALKCGRTTEDEADDLVRHGLTWDEVNRVFFCYRKNEDGTPFQCSL